VVAVHTASSVLASLELLDPVALVVAEPVHHPLLLQPKQSLEDREQTVLVVVAAVAEATTAFRNQ